MLVLKPYFQSCVKNLLACLAFMRHARIPHECNYSLTEFDFMDQFVIMVYHKNLP
jgi:hypothetical protein